jgi:hypothetical protein
MPGKVRRELRGNCELAHPEYQRVFADRQCANRRFASTGLPMPLPYTAALRASRLALVGLRVAGKSTLGAMLAKEFEELRREMAGRLMPDAIEARR